MHWYNVVKITEAVQARSDCVSSQHTSSEARGKNACVKCQYGRLCNVQIVLTFFCYFVCYFYFAFSGDVVILQIYCYCTVSIICFLYVDVEHTD